MIIYLLHCNVALYISFREHLKFSLHRYGMRYMAKVMRQCLMKKFPDAEEKEILKVREIAIQYTRVPLLSCLSCRAKRLKLKLKTVLYQMADLDCMSNTRPIFLDQRLSVSHVCLYLHRKLSGTCIYETKSMLKLMWSEKNKLHVSKGI